jgi:hypothetical protein
MTYEGKAAVCSEIRTKHSTQGENHVEFLNVKPGGTYRNRQALKGKNFLSTNNQTTLPPIRRYRGFIQWPLSGRFMRGPHTSA